MNNKTWIFATSAHLLRTDFIMQVKPSLSFGLLLFNYKSTGVRWRVSKICCYSHTVIFYLSSRLNIFFFYVFKRYPEHFSIAYLTLEHAGVFALKGQCEFIEGRDWVFSQRHNILPRRLYILNKYLLLN